ncbi:MAG: hypothetical protein ACRYHQ_01870 [Janthinobacterium lividum]
MSRIASDLPVRLDVAVRRAAAQPVDPVTRAGLVELEDALRAHDRTPEGIDPPSLIGVIVTAIMPHLSNPGVLNAERRRRLLERLEAHIAAVPQGAAVVPGAGIALRQELENLRLLRQSQDSLIVA